MLTYQQIHHHLFEALQALENGDSYTRHHAIRALNMLEQELHDLVVIPPLDTYPHNELASNLEKIQELGKRGVLERMTYSISNGLELDFHPVNTAELQFPLISEQEPTKLALRTIESRTRTIMEVLSCLNIKNSKPNKA